MGETRACGSGACAAAWVAIKRGLTSPQLQVSMPGGDLQVVYKDSRIALIGPAEYVDRNRVIEI